MPERLCCGHSVLGMENLWSGSAEVEAEAEEACVMKEPES